MKARSKISRNRAQAAFEAWLISHQPRVHSSGDWGYPYFIDTNYGPLYISFSVAEGRTHKHVGGECYDWLNTCFREVERAKGNVNDMNIHTGKWNHHLQLDGTVDGLKYITGLMQLYGIL